MASALRKFAALLNRQWVPTVSVPVMAFGGNKGMNKIHFLSLMMSQSSGKGKHAANYNRNVLNDKNKNMSKVLWEI